VTISGVGPVLFRQGLEEPVPKVGDAAWDEDDRVTHVEVADFPTAIESPAVPRFGREAHLASLRHSDIPRARHSLSIQGISVICLVPGPWDPNFCSPTRSVRHF